MSSEALEGLSRKDAAWAASPAEEQRRRSVYMLTVRSRILPLMTTFDFCDTTHTCGQRDVTIVPTQALALLNNEFMHEQSGALATRVETDAGPEIEKQAALAWKLALNRDPEAGEVVAALAHLREQAEHFAASTAPSPQPRTPAQLALASLCLVLLNTNEFIYVD